jgi:transposase InsO family protein
VEHVRRVHREVSPDYGSPRVYRELDAAGIPCSLNTIAKVMKDAGLRARTKRKFRIVTTDSKHHLAIAPNLLQQNFQAEKPNSVWLTDITYVDTLEGVTYLCTVQDLCSRRIVGWASGRTMTAQLVLSALQQAIDLRAPQPGLIVHSDRGSQFASLEYQQRLVRHGFLQSMSGKGNCYDNAPMESFFRSYKVEEVYWAKYETHEQATRGVIDYIDRFYNRIRRHSSLGYVSPIAFEQAQLFESKQVG